jgi:hypothetical protein
MTDATTSLFPGASSARFGTLKRMLFQDSVVRNDLTGMECDSITFGNYLLWCLPHRFGHFVVRLNVLQLRLQKKSLGLQFAGRGQVGL